MLAALKHSGLAECLRQLLALQMDKTAGPKKQTTHQHLLQTLLFLPVVGLHRPWDLRGYTGGALALLSQRNQAYGYEYVERYLATLAKPEVAERLRESLASWTDQLWLSGPDPLPAIFYVDGHHKPVYSDKLLPRGLVGKLGKILPCRGLVLLHDEAGHPLLITTGRGDTHLTVGLPRAIEQYERATGNVAVQTIVVDREAMSGEFLSYLVAQNRRVITLLRKDQYEDLASFSEVSAFEAWRWDKHATLTHQLAQAYYRLKVPSAPDGELKLRAALIKDLRPQKRGEAANLVPVVSTWEGDDYRTMAQLYQARWQRQENIIKDWLLPMGLDVNHGYAKSEVENSEVSKRRTRLKSQLAACQKYGPQASQRALAQGQARHHLHQQIYRECRETDRLEMRLAGQFFDQGVGWEQAEQQARQSPEISQRRERLEKMREKRERLWEESGKEGRKADQYEQREKQLQAELVELSARERQMYELNDQKDQIMSCLKLSLVNLVMWLREHYFPASYRNVTWERLVPFFRLGGWIRWEVSRIEVELRGFNDRELSRDLSWVCEKMNAAQLKLADGRTLVFTIKEAKEASASVSRSQAEAA